MCRCDKMELKRIDKDVFYRLNENAEDYSLIYDKPKMEIDEDKLNMAFDKAITYYIQSIKNYVYEDYYCQPLENILFERELLNKIEYQKSATAKDYLIKLNSYFFRNIYYQFLNNERTILIQGS